MSLKDIAKQVIQLMPELPREAGSLVDCVTEAGHLADLVTANLELEVDEKQDVLETFDVKARIRKVLQLLSRQLEVLKMRERINSQIKEEMGNNQREYVLRQQLKAIKEELGELTTASRAISTSSRRRSRRRSCPRRPRRSPRSSSSACKGMQRRSAEYTVVRTYLDWIVDLPWSISTEDQPRASPRSARCLDEDHYGLEKVKKRIVEYLAVRKLKNDKKGPILCLVGPARRRQDLARSLDRARARPQVRAHLARRRARRGRDPRPPPHLRRRAARAASSRA